VPRAVSLADELLSGWAPIVETIELIPSSHGRFEVSLDGELIFSKKALGRHAAPGEIVGLVRERVGEEISRG
jgi:selenoprotein W-related protein